MSLEISRQYVIATIVKQLVVDHGQDNASLQQVLEKQFPIAEELKFAEHIRGLTLPVPADRVSEHEPDCWTKIDDASVVKYVPIKMLDRSSDGVWEYWCVESKYAGLRRFLKWTATDNALMQKHAKARIFAEFRALDRFSHKNIVSVYDVGKIRVAGKTHLFIATEFIDGINLKEWRSKHTPSPAKAAYITAVLAKALADAQHHVASQSRFLPGTAMDGADHKSQLLMHLDLKPTNVMVANSPSREADENTLRLIDFGSAGTQENAIAEGTVGYLAPERIRKRDDLPPDATWDVFALGAMVVFLETGSSPIPPKIEGLDDETARAAWDDWLAQLPVPDRFLKAICRKAMAFTPAERFQSPGELYTSLTAFAENRPVPLVSVIPSTVEKERMLFERLWTRVNRDDHDQLVARMSLIVAGYMFLTTTLYLWLVLTGMEYETAWVIVGNTNVILIAFLMVFASWIGRGQLFSISMFQPVGIFAILTAVVCFRIAPLTETPATAVQIVTLLYGMLLIALGSTVPQWKMLKWYSYPVLLMGTLLNEFFSNERLPEFSPVPFWYACAIGAALLAWSVERSVTKTRAVREHSLATVGLH